MTNDEHQHPKKAASKTTEEKGGPAAPGSFKQRADEMLMLEPR